MLSFLYSEPQADRHITDLFSSPQIDALPEIVEAVEGKVEVFLDGGVRKGTDVLKALALGAQAVFVGRPVIWGLASQVIGAQRNKYSRLPITWHPWGLADARSM